MTQRLGALLFLVACTAVLSACDTVPAKDDPWFGADKFKHFGTSTAIAAISAHAAKNGGASECHAFQVGLGVTVGIGAAKEFADEHIRHKGWSWRDFAWDVAGGVLGSTMATQCW